MTWPLSKRTRDLLDYVLCMAILGLVFLGISLATPGAGVRDGAVGWVVVVIGGIAAACIPAYIAHRNTEAYLRSIPVCEDCGKKIIPTEVRFSWWRRLKYYRCDCGRPS